MIVNAHAHIGESRVFDHDFPEQALIDGMDKYEIDVSIVQPLIGPGRELEPVAVIFFNRKLYMPGVFFHPAIHPFGPF